MTSGWFNRPYARCGIYDPESGESCLLGPAHPGFHKTNHHAWPNERDTLDWAAIGRDILLGRTVPFYSARELDYAIEAAGGWANAKRIRDAFLDSSAERAYQT
jgi:hypothetical protein